MCGYTSDFDRSTAGFSPDRVDALVWAVTELHVETMPKQGYFEFLRIKAEALKPKRPPPPPTIYARGSVEWATSAGTGQGRAMITSSPVQCKIPAWSSPVQCKIPARSWREQFPCEGSMNPAQHLAFP